MSQPYEYTDNAGDRLTIDPPAVGEDHDETCVKINAGANGWKLHVHLPAAERQAAAQALAGDRYEVVEKLADWERDFLEKQSCIDPVDVKVGDVVEVEANDGSWLVRGEVAETNVETRSHAFAVLIDGIKFVPHPPSITVRRLSRAEPDPADVEALTAIVRDVNVVTWDSSEEVARELVRRGVRVTGGERS